MRGNVVDLNDSRRCPSCEYDLHGNTSGRCPECGAPILGAASSRLPWLYQKARGGIRAYVQTVALLLFKPRDLANETKQRIQLSPAHRFHHESMALATFIGTGLFAVIFLLRGGRLEALLNPAPSTLFGEPQHFMSWAPIFSVSRNVSISIPIPATLYWMPVYVWTDRLLILIPVLPALYFSLRITAWCYRQFFRLGKADSSITRRRAVRLAYYGSGMAPIMVALIGAGTLLRIGQNDEWAWAVGRWSSVLWVVGIIFALATPVIFYYPTLTLLARAGKGALRHSIAMVLLFPVITALTFAATGFLVFWIFGYVTVAVWSMAN
jgi:predicted RNA-binding Zn-ribbon protein involved in translation (DUF1610 family)